MIEIPHSIYWLAIGMMFIILEVVFIQNVGFIFAAFSALTVFLLLEFDAISYKLLQDIAWFFAFIIVWGAVLWVPLQKFGRHKIGKKFTNIVGSNAILLHSINNKEIGSIEWQGIKIKAKIANSSKNDKLEEGAKVVIVETKKDIAYVKKR